MNAGYGTPGREGDARLDGPQRQPVVHPDGDAVLRAVHLEAHVVAPRVVAGVRDDRERPVVEREHDRGGVDVADLGEEGGAAVAAGRVHLDDLAAGHPPHRVEVVHGAVAQQPARAGDVRRGRRGRVERRGAERVQPAQLARTARPPAPRRSRGRSAAGSRSARRRRSAATCSRSCTLSARVRAIGFSQKTGTPARVPASSSSGCAPVPAATTMPSTPAARTAAGESAVSAPTRAATSSARPGTRSVTTRLSTSGRSDSVCAWNSPIRPSPRSPRRTGTPSLSLAVRWAGGRRRCRGQSPSRRRRWRRQPAATPAPSKGPQRAVTAGRPACDDGRRGSVTENTGGQVKAGRRAADT